MTVLKFKRGKENISLRISDYLERGIIRKSIAGYLERGENDNSRVIAKSFINIPEQADQIDWGNHMDATRELLENRSGDYVKYYHFIVSPDPRNNCTPDTLVEYAREWASEWFGDLEKNKEGRVGCYESAIVLHNDNKNHILHAHIIVNNVNLLNGWHLHINNAQFRDLFRTLQKLALKYNLTPHRFKNEYFNMEESDVTLEDFEIEKDSFEFEKNGSDNLKTEAPLTAPRTIPESGIASRGESSWIDCIRKSIDIAMGVSNNLKEFVSALEELGVKAESNPKDENDFMYSIKWKQLAKSDKGKEHADEHGMVIVDKKVSGKRLGSKFKKSSIEAEFKWKRLQDIHIHPDYRRAVLNGMADESIGRGGSEILSYDSERHPEHLPLFLNDYSPDDEAISDRYNVDVFAAMQKAFDNVRVGIVAGKPNRVSSRSDSDRPHSDFNRDRDIAKAMQKAFDNVRIGKISRRREVYDRKILASCAVFIAVTGKQSSITLEGFNKQLKTLGIRMAKTKNTDKEKYARYAREYRRVTQAKETALRFGIIGNESYKAPAPKKVIHSQKRITGKSSSSSTRKRRNFIDNSSKRSSRNQTRDLNR